MGTLWLLLPLLGAGVVHGLILKYNGLSFLCRPIDHGIIYRRRPLFGANKTWRGVAAVAVGCSIILGLQSVWLHQFEMVREIELFDYAAVNGWLLGLWVGVLAELSELPNSFVKRRYGITPGQIGDGMAGALFRVWDQVDLLLGLWIAYSIVVDVTMKRVLISALVLLVMHPLITFIGYQIGMRKTRF
jgi:CDP-diglyceride synthetase